MKHQAAWQHGSVAGRDQPSASLVASMSYYSTTWTAIAACLVSMLTVRVQLLLGQLEWHAGHYTKPQKSVQENRAAISAVIQEYLDSRSSIGMLAHQHTLGLVSAAVSRPPPHVLCWPAAP